MPAAPEPAGLAGLLLQELRQLESFIALLRQEQSWLTDGAVEQLPALAEHKTRAAEALAALAGNRETELRKLGLAPGRAGMEAWSTSPAGRRDDWLRLLSLAAEARSLNETNGQLIGLRLGHNQQALGLLMAAADRATTYGPDGQPKAGGGGRSLGSA